MFTIALLAYFQNCFNICFFFLHAVRKRIHKLKLIQRNCNYTNNNIVIFVIIIKLLGNFFETKQIVVYFLAERKNFFFQIGRFLSKFSILNISFWPCLYRLANSFLYLNLNNKIGLSFEPISF